MCILMCLFDIFKQGYYSILDDYPPFVVLSCFLNFLLLLFHLFHLFLLLFYLILLCLSFSLSLILYLLLFLFLYPYLSLSPLFKFLFFFFFLGLFELISFFLSFFSSQFHFKDVLWGCGSWRWIFLFI